MEQDMEVKALCYTHTVLRRPASPYLSCVHFLFFAFFIIQLLQGTVSRIKGEDPRGSGLQNGWHSFRAAPRFRRRHPRHTFGEEDFWHLIGPNLGAACVCMQTVSEPGQDTVFGFWRELE